MNVPSDNTELIKIAVELRPKVIKALASKFEHTLTKEDIDDVFYESCTRVWEKLMHVKTTIWKSWLAKVETLKAISLESATTLP